MGLETRGSGGAGPPESGQQPAAPSKQRGPGFGGSSLQALGPQWGCPAHCVLSSTSQVHASAQTERAKLDPQKEGREAGPAFLLHSERQDSGRFSSRGNPEPWLEGGRGPACGLVGGRCTPHEPPGCRLEGRLAPQGQGRVPAETHHVHFLCTPARVSRDVQPTPTTQTHIHTITLSLTHTLTHNTTYTLTLSHTNRHSHTTLTC